MTKIKNIVSRQIFDSRGNPTVETDVITTNNIIGRAAVPSGASTGEHESVELRDELDSYMGKSVFNAVKNVNEIISKELNFKTGEANLKSLQEQWKQIGPVPKKDAEQIWNKFRSSCDSFFEARKSYFKERRLEEKDNLIKKNNILDQLSLCLGQESSDELLKKLKTLQSQWVQIGHVSYKQKDAVNNKYNELSTKIFEKFTSKYR